MMAPRAGVRGKPFDPRPYLTEVGKRAFEDFLVFTRHAWPWGRGSGKTTNATLIHMYVATLIPRCTTIYFSDTIRRAKMVAWQDFAAFGKLAGGRPRENDMTVWFPNGSVVWVTGMDHITEVNRNRGIKRIAFVHGDEMQDQASELINYMVTKAFGPRMDDNVKEHDWEGRFLLSGTGGRDDGYWFESCRPESGWKVRRATQWDNPYSAIPDKTFRKTCDDAQPKIEVIDLTQPVAPMYADGQFRHVDTHDKETRREWFAEFNSGGKLQIFTHIGTIDRKLLPKQLHILIVGADFGTVDKCAGAAWGANKHVRTPFLLRYKEQHDLSGSKQVRFHRQFAEEVAEEYGFPRHLIQLVGDGGGIGKALVKDIQEAENAWDVEVTDKGPGSKVAKLRTLSGSLKDEDALVVDDLKGWIRAARTMEWHPDHVGEKVRGHTPDVVDAAKDPFGEVKRQHIYSAPPTALIPELEKELAIEAGIRERMKRSRQTPYEEN
jgi:hypothetical protein